MEDVVVPSIESVATTRTAHKLAPSSLSPDIPKKKKNTFLIPPTLVLACWLDLQLVVS